ncbi:HopJ type III effector protein [Spirosomataceae bacterium TFI 002]|nr:HopJ type III effector protein [Spirosomataceae bacterium TFI 002]
MLQSFLNKLKKTPNEVEFQEVISLIEEHYTFTPTEFQNGDVKNEVGQNSGSCKIFAFGLLNKLSKEDTLACFGDFYRKDVLENPDGDDHQNIRNFINYGWGGVKFKGEALALKA